MCIFLLLFCFFLPTPLLWFLNSIIINIVQNVTKKKCTLDFSWWVFFFVCFFFLCFFLNFLYKAGRSGLLRLLAFGPLPRSPPRLLPTGAPCPFLDEGFRVPRHAPTPPHFPADLLTTPPSRTAGRARPPLFFKIDLCIFIYVYIKKERGRGLNR